MFFTPARVVLVRLLFGDHAGDDLHPLAGIRNVTMKMTNDEIQMSNECRIPNVEIVTTVDHGKQSLDYQLSGKHAHTLLP